MGDPWSQLKIFNIKSPTPNPSGIVAIFSKKGSNWCMFFSTSTGFFLSKKLIHLVHGMTLCPITSWLVVGQNPVLKNDGVRQLRDDEIPNINGKIKFMATSHHQPRITRLFCVKHFSAKTLDAYRGTGVSSVASGGATPKLFPIDLGVQKKRLSQKTPKHVRFMRFTSKKKSVNEIDNQKKKVYGIYWIYNPTKKYRKIRFSWDLPSIDHIF